MAAVEVEMEEDVEKVEEVEVAALLFSGTLQLRETTGLLGGTVTAPVYMYLMMSFKSSRSTEFRRMARLRCRMSPKYGLFAANTNECAGMKSPAHVSMTSVNCPVCW